METKSIKFRKLKEQLFGHAVYIVLVLFFLINALLSKGFFSMQVIWLLVRQMAGLACVALGLNVVVSSGNIDISVGSIMSLAAVVCTQIGLASGNYYLGILGALGVCILAGAINGFIITHWKIQSMIATLATQMVFRGASQLISAWVVTIKGDTVEMLGIYNIGGFVPVQIVPIVVLTILTWFVLKKTVLGKQLEAVGNNPIAARLAGISSSVVIVVGYIICAVFAGMGGLVDLFRTAACDTSSFGLQYEIFALASVAIGGSSISGGSSKVLGTIAGVAIMQLITMTANMHNIPYAFANIIKCAIIVIAIFLQQKKRA